MGRGGEGRRGERRGDGEDENGRRERQNENGLKGWEFGGSGRQ